MPNNSKSKALELGALRQLLRRVVHGALFLYHFQIVVLRFSRLFWLRESSESVLFILLLFRFPHNVLLIVFQGVFFWRSFFLFM